MATLGVTVFTLSSRSKERAAAEQSRDEARRLRERVLTQDRAVAELQASLQQLQSNSLSSSSSSAQAQSSRLHSAEAELIRRLQELKSIQAQTLGLVEQVAAKTGAMEPPEREAQRRRAAASVLKESLKDNQQQLEGKTQKMSELIALLKVPDEIAAMDPLKGLNMPHLRSYWPYFQTRREREAVQLVIDRIQLRLIQDDLDRRIEEKLETNTSKSGSP